jgi:hypothetical protein
MMREGEKSLNNRDGFGEQSNGAGAGRGRKTPDLGKRDRKGKGPVDVQKKPSWEEAWRRLGSGEYER